MIPDRWAPKTATSLSLCRRVPEGARCFPPATPRLRTVLWLLAIVVTLEGNAHAYSDPGSGALLLQMGLAAVVGCLYYVRRLWIRLGGKRDQTKAGLPEDPTDLGRP